MDNISICVTFISVILGIAYPILLEVVSRLDEKYESVAVIELFRAERENRIFILSLGISLLFIFIWMLRLRPLIKIKGLNWLIDNSAQYLLITSTIILILAFFYFVRKVLIYYTLTRFIPYLIAKHGEEIN